MAYLSPTPRQVQELLSLPGDRPVRMLNLLRFRDLAEGHQLSGEELYDRYADRVRPLLTEVGGRIIYVGRVMASLIGPEGEYWDRMLIVEYPSRDRFIGLSRHPAFEEAAHQRTAALADWRLIALSVD